jgi:Zinc-binding dehydrogenase
LASMTSIQTGTTPSGQNPTRHPYRHRSRRHAGKTSLIYSRLLKAELPEAGRVCWETYECRPSGSRLIRMAPRFDDGSLSVHVSAMYYWQDTAQAHRAVEQDDIPGEVVLIVDDDLAATLEV